MSATRITDVGVRELAQGLPALTGLALEGTRISDAALASFKHTKSLSWLALDRTNVTDAGLLQLPKAAALNELTLRGTAVSDEGITAIQRRFPGASVSK